MEDVIMINGFGDDDDCQSLLLNAISAIDSLLHMQYQIKDRKRKCSGSNETHQNMLGLGLQYI